MSHNLWNPNNMIYVKVGEQDLQSQIKRWAGENGLNIFTGSGCDLIAVGYLFAIVEKEEVGSKEWGDFLDYLRESEDHTPCFVLNSIRIESEEGVTSLSFLPVTSSSDFIRILDDILKESLNIRMLHCVKCGDNYDKQL